MLAWLTFSAPALADQTRPLKDGNICTLQEFRTFDFLVGNWIVKTKQGEVAGINSIELILDQCALQEHWQAEDGFRGTSIIFFDANINQWHQTWIDNRGSALRLQGNFNEGEMLLSGQKPNTQEFHEIRWRPLKNGQIKQYWRMTLDQGKTWIERFEGYYIPQDGK